jgi:asparagine synthase (glutamine-hydrolysing)
MENEDGTVRLVFNGEIYGFEPLREELAARGHRFRSRCDAEVVLHLWEEIGPACVERLDGMFALFIWDELAKTGFAARDRLGVKPFAYLDDDGFAFASEAQALLPVLGRPRANLEAIVEYLVAPAFSGVASSPFERIRYLQPGHVLRVDRDGVTTRRYWRWTVKPEPVEPAELRDVFERSVRAAMRSDEPLGVFASGGLDSTAIARVARREVGELPAFTVTFDGQDRWRDSRIVVSDDTPFARSAAAELGLDHHEVPFDRATLVAELEAVARVDDALPAWEQELSQRTLAREASRHVRGVLVGDAADETHYGYHFLLDDEALASPATIVRRLGSVPVRREVDGDPLARLVAEYRALAPEGASPVVATTQLIVERWLPRLLHNGDIHNMAFGLEPRVPFAATALVDLAARVDPQIALRDGVEKALLREALRGLIPEAIRTRRKSALPKDQATSTVFRAEARRLLADPHPVVRRLVDSAALAPTLDRDQLDERERAQLFRVICLHHWAVAHGVVA